MRLLQASLISRLKIMAHLDIAERRLPQDGRINLELDGNPIDVRVATIPSVNGESVSLRLLTRQKFDMEKLGLDADTRWRRSTSSSRRPTASSSSPARPVPARAPRSTPSCASSTPRNAASSPSRIPVENKLDGVVQIAVKPEIDLTFAAGLRTILRGDPERGHGRGNARPGDRGDRDPRRAHGPPRLLHAAHERRRGRHLATAGHGHRAVPHLRRPARVPGAASRAHALPALQAARASRGRLPARASASRWSTRTN